MIMNTIPACHTVIAYIIANKPGKDNDDMAKATLILKLF